jgi:hypothetical protein
MAGVRSTPRDRLAAYCGGMLTDRSRPIPVVVAIDVEPDGRGSRPGSGVGLAGFHAVRARLEALRPRLETATGRAVGFAWFLRMDPQVELVAGRPDAIAIELRSSIAALRARGDGLGLHTHFGRWDPSRDGWLVDHGDPAWIDHVLRSSFATFASTFGEPCRQHRSGDRWSSPAAFDTVAELGALVDLTIEPGQRGTDNIDPTARATGRIPSYLDAAQTAHPHRDGPLWLLPLSAADPGPTLPVAKRWARRLRYLGQPLHRPLVLERAWPSPDAFWSLVERHLDEQPAPYLAIAIRSDVALEPRMAGVDAILEALLHRPLVRRLAFTDGPGALRELGVLAAAEAA